jgi:hypothetical protein
MYNSTTVTLYNFGCPRTGNPEFVEWAEGILDSASVRMRRQLDIVPSIPPRSIGYRHIRTEVWNKHSDGHPDSYVACDGSGEDPQCGDSEEHPALLAPSQDGRAHQVYGLRRGQLRRGRQQRIRVNRSVGFHIVSLYVLHTCTVMYS